MTFNPTDAAQKANFVQFAYNMYSSNSNTLAPAPDPGLAALGYKLLFYLSAHDFQNVKFYGYLAAPAASPGDLILAIRGTEDLNEWLLDFAALPLPFQGMGLVAAGFRAIANSFQLTDATGATATSLTTAVANVNSTTPVTSVTVLGHSLGGALATHTAAELASTKPAGPSLNLSLWTYASPRVGFPDFVSRFNKEVPSTYRIWNALDIVPNVPTFPYVHVNQSEELKQDQDQISHLAVNPLCEHHLSTYQWLLDPTDYSIDAGCQVATPATAPTTAAVAERAAGAGFAPTSVDEQTQGAAALALALREPSPDNR
jgi:alpha-beta hydrolase superfamily lysophospholipase